MQQNVDTSIKCFFCMRIAFARINCILVNYLKNCALRRYYVVHYSQNLHNNDQNVHASPVGQEN